MLGSPRPRARNCCAHDYEIRTLAFENCVYNRRESVYGREGEDEGISGCESGRRREGLGLRDKL